jgi:RNA polymerase primary sigma factor
MLDTCETVPEVEEFMMRMIMDSMEALIMNSLNDDEFDLRIAERVNELNDKAREMAEELERLVTVEELVNELEADEEYIRETIRLSGNSIEYIKI